MDMEEHDINERRGTQTREQTIETSRKNIVSSLKSGSNLVIFTGKFAKNLNEWFKDAKFWKLDNLFSTTEVLNEKFIKDNVITPEEDVDYMGNKGFMSNKDFKLTLLISGNYESLDELFKVLNVDKKYFKVVRILG